ncbi:MAG: biotin/lipoyl-containing protein, partial [Bacillus sp. (in: firmicutes)]
LYTEIKRPVTSFDVIAYALYPKVFLQYVQTIEKYGEISNLDTMTFLYGMRPGEEIEVEIETGKTLIVRMISVGHAHADGTRNIYFELNGQQRQVVVKDESIASTVVTKAKADLSNPNHIGATMPGTVIKVVVEKGEKVQKGDHLIITEAMKMETTVQAPFTGTIKDIYVANGEAIATGDLLIEIAKE